GPRDTARAKARELVPVPEAQEEEVAAVVVVAVAVAVAVVVAVADSTTHRLGSLRTAPSGLLPKRSPLRPHFGIV
ncbi:MAG: hypothetical protein WAU91_04460, partial [Desulfatitalea sp.]